MSFSFYTSKKRFFLGTRKLYFTSCKPNDLSCVKNQEPAEFRRQENSRHNDINKCPHMSACSPSTQGLSNSFPEGTYPMKPKSQL